jgi:hypothetical protein
MDSPSLSAHASKAGRSRRLELRLRTYHTSHASGMETGYLYAIRGPRRRSCDAYIRSGRDAKGTGECGFCSSIFLIIISLSAISMSVLRTSR